MHKKILFTTVLCAALIAALVLPTPALAGNIFRFSGDSADAVFSTVDTFGCIFTDAYVFANKGKQQSPPGSPGKQQWADVWISRYDACNDYIELLGAYGSTSLGSGAFQVDKNLNSASLNTTINVYDYISDTSFDVTVNLGWTGAGALSKGRSSSQYRSGKCKYQSRWNGSWRSATASGTISDGSTNYAASPSSYATIQSAKSGDMTIGCN